MVRRRRQHWWGKGERPTARCAHCHATFALERPWQRFCRDSHRVMASRARSTAEVA